MPAIKILLVLLSVVLLGCSNSQSGPPSTQETSASRSALHDRIRFIENYVTFRRSYDKLEYDIVYQNNGDAVVPAPSDWDIKLLAVVPKAEVADWIPAGVKGGTAQPPKWLTSMPGSIPVAGVTEWYRAGKSEIGVDRATSTIAYRNSTLPD